MINAKEPFDLLNNDTKIIPMLPQNKLNAMIDNALSTPQIQVNKSKIVNNKLMRSGAFLSIAACLLLFIATGQQNNNAIYSDQFDAVSNEIGDMLVLATLEDQ